MSALRAVFAALPGSLVLVSQFAPYIRLWSPDTFTVRLQNTKPVYLMWTTLGIAIVLSFLAQYVFTQIQSNNILVGPQFLNSNAVLAYQITVSAIFQYQVIRNVQPNVLDVAPVVLCILMALAIESRQAEILAWTLMAFQTYRFALWAYSQIAGLPEMRMKQLLNLDN